MISKILARSTNKPISTFKALGTSLLVSSVLTSQLKNDLNTQKANFQSPGQEQHNNILPKLLKLTSNKKQGTGSEFLGVEIDDNLVLTISRNTSNNKEDGSSAYARLTKSNLTLSYLFDESLGIDKFCSGVQYFPYKIKEGGPVSVMLLKTKTRSQIVNK